MGLFNDCIQDAADYTSDSEGFGVSIIITDSNGLTITVYGLTAKHHTQVDSETGAPVSSKVASIAISEQKFYESNSLFRVRNSNGEVDMKGYKVSVKDSTGSTCNYKINTQFPDETIGLLVFTLSDYA